MATIEAPRSLEEKTENRINVLFECGLSHCRKTFGVPAQVYEKIIAARSGDSDAAREVGGKKYGSFYVSKDCFDIYCSERHFNDSTEN